MNYLLGRFDCCRLKTRWHFGDELLVSLLCFRECVLCICVCVCLCLKPESREFDCSAFTRRCRYVGTLCQCKRIIFTHLIWFCIIDKIPGQFHSVPLSNVLMKFVFVSCQCTISHGYNLHQTQPKCMKHKFEYMYVLW